VILCHGPENVYSLKRRWEKLKPLKFVVLTCDSVTLIGFWVHGRADNWQNFVDTCVLSSVARILLLHVYLTLNSSNSRRIWREFNCVYGGSAPCLFVPSAIAVFFIDSWLHLPT
jgi:hypothetical protein